MRSVDLRDAKVDLAELLHLAEEGAVLVVASDGHEFIVAEADDFDSEVDALRSSSRFQSLLDQRLQSPARIPIEDIQREIAQELSVPPLAHEQ
jgi:hypothetical protein